MCGSFGWLDLYWFDLTETKHTSPGSDQTSSRFIVTKRPRETKTSKNRECQVSQNDHGSRSSHSMPWQQTIFLISISPSLLPNRQIHRHRINSARIHYLRENVTETWLAWLSTLETVEAAGRRCEHAIPLLIEGLVTRSRHKPNYSQRERSKKYIKTNQQPPAWHNIQNEACSLTHRACAVDILVRACFFKYMYHKKYVRL